MSSYDDMARDAFGDTELAREAARRLEEEHRAELEAIADRVAFEEQLEDESGGERFGFGVCATGRCVEPCGEHGGCARGSRRRGR